MKKIYHTIYEMRVFLTLWLSQSFSALGSAMTAYAIGYLVLSAEGFCFDDGHADGVFVCPLCGMQFVCWCTI